METNSDTSLQIKQLAREKARKRFNLWFVYAPISLFFLLFAVILIILFWESVVVRWTEPDADLTTMQTFVSGLADAVLVLVLLPTVLIGVAALGGVVYAWSSWRERQAQKTAARADEPTKLPLSWRIEQRLTASQQKISAASPKVARPIISLNSWVAFAQTLLTHLKNFILRN